MNLKKCEWKKRQFPDVLLKNRNKLHEREPLHVYDDRQSTFEDKLKSKSVADLQKVIDQL